MHMIDRRTEAVARVVRKDTSLPSATGHISTREFSGPTVVPSRPSQLNPKAAILKVFAAAWASSALKG